MFETHVHDVPFVLKKLETKREGLSEEEAGKRLSQYGRNALPEAKKSTLLEIFFDQFKSPIIYVLLVAASVSFLIGEMTDGWFIMGVLLINALIGSYQEYTAGQKAEGLKQSVKTRSILIREGRRREYPSEEVTLGDIVVLESGTKIPADLRLIESNGLLVDESLLTGESVNVTKDAAFMAEDVALPVADRQNCVYAGSFVTRGRGLGVVSAIGVSTEVGRIASLLAEDEGGKPPLITRMERFSLMIAKVIGVIVLLMFAVGWSQGQSLQELFFFSVALAVSSIPEGLPVAIVVALTAASLVMSKRHVIVRKLASLEGLGSCTLIASDKTGTLTKNELSVDRFVTREGTRTADEMPSELESLRCAVLAGEAQIVQTDGKYHYSGDQVDVALARWAVELDSTHASLRSKLEATYEIPYEPENQYAAAMFGGVHYLKGSPEAVMEACGLSEEEKQKLHEDVKEWAAQGYRNLALAYRCSDDERFTLDGYVWLGFVAIIDPLRDGVKEAVKNAHQAGIEVAMITGDHPKTALFIAKELGITEDEKGVMSGRELKMWEERGENPEEIREMRVFARVSPEQKQKLVNAFQKLDHFVAVTGDGVNDAPALKRANIGIAMGRSGTDVARDSSDMILTDDHFRSIVNGIEEGRVAYDNIRKVIYLLVSTGFAEIILVALSLLFLLPVPLLPVQLLWLNLVTNGIQDVALGLEKAEPGVLRRKPRDPKEPIFNRVMIRRILVGGLYMGGVGFALFYWFLSTGMEVDMARNLTLLLMVLFENVHAVNSRSERVYLHQIHHWQNRLLPLSIIIAQSVHIICMHIPFTQELLSLQPVEFTTWLLLLGVSLGLAVLMEMDKRLSKRSWQFRRES